MSLDRFQRELDRLQRDPEWTMCTQKFKKGAAEIAKKMEKSNADAMSIYAEDVEPLVAARWRKLMDFYGIKPLKPLNAERFQRDLQRKSAREKIGMAVCRQKIKKRAVAEIAKKIGKSERYVWGCVKQGEKALARHEKMRRITLKVLEDEIARRPRISPRNRASYFLFEQLRYGPRPANEVKALARKAGIADRTLLRASRVSVKKKRIGGRTGSWIWEASARMKEIHQEVLEAHEATHGLRLDSDQPKTAGR